MNTTRMVPQKAGPHDHASRAEDDHLVAAPAVQPPAIQEPLDSSGNNFPLTLTKRAYEGLTTGKRRARYLRKVFRQVAQRKAEMLCGTGTSGASVQVVCSTERQQSRRFGVFFCKSTACPGCSYHAAVKQVNKLVPCLEGAIAGGHSVFFFTTTLRHDSSTPAKHLLKGLSDCWNNTNKMLKRHIGAKQYEFYRSTDYTWSATSGHHFHIHGFLVLKRKMKVKELAELPDVVFKAWNRRAIDTGFGSCSRDAFFFELVKAGSTAAAASRYVVKLTKAAFEVAGKDWKRGHGESLTQFQLLEEMFKAPEGSELFSKLKKAYREFRKATFGMRTYSQSGGFKALADLRLVEELDEEEHIPEVPSPLDVIANPFTSDERIPWTLFTIVKPLWRVMVKFGDTEDVQGLLEDGACQRFACDQDRWAFVSLVRILEREGGKTEKEHEWTLIWESFRRRYLMQRFFDPRYVGEGAPVGLAAEQMG